MTTPEKFVYSVPKEVLRNRRKRRADAWKTICPGVIVQRSLDFEELFNLVHEPSGNIFCSSHDIENLQEAAGDLSRLPCDFTVETAQGVYRNLSKLSHFNAERFWQAIRKTGPPKHWKAYLIRAAKNYEKCRKEFVSGKK